MCRSTIPIGSIREDHAHVIDISLHDPACVFVASAADLLASFSDRAMQLFIEKQTERAPTLADAWVAPAAAMWSKPTPEAPTGMFARSQSPSVLPEMVQIAQGMFKRGEVRRRHADIQTILRGMRISRSAATLSDTEKSILRQLALATDSYHITLDAWIQDTALFLYADGNADLAVDDAHVHHPDAGHAPGFLRAFCNDALQRHETFLKRLYSRLQALSGPQVSTGAGSVRGNRWLRATDIATSRVFTIADDKTAALPLGILYNEDVLLGFNKATSITCIAPSGAGKSQASVIPSLASYPGSVIVFDPKMELWNLCAGYREQNFGPCFKFAPADNEYQTHQYNPLDLVSTQPDLAAKECRVLANTIIPPAQDKERYWAARAQSLLWAGLMIVALGHTGTERTINHVLPYLMLDRPQQGFDGTFDFTDTVTGRTIEILKALAEATGLLELANIANSLERDVTSDHAGSVLETMKEGISVFSSMPQVANAVAISDWHPLMLREQPGTTVFICIPPGEVEIMSPLVRVVIQQHIATLVNGYEMQPGELPITAFIDEAPSLGRFMPLLDIMQLGRSAGVRLAIYAQDYEQLVGIYKDDAPRFFNEAEVRLVMNPSPSLVKLIEPMLGNVMEHFTEKDRPLAEPSDLLGRAFVDNVIALGKNEYPARLDKQFGYQVFADRLNLPVRWQSSHEERQENV